MSAFSIVPIIGSFFVVMIIIAFFVRMILNWRIVVPTNEVHITQGGKGTKSYGRDLPEGNVYYNWPSLIPRFGISSISLPVSIFDIELVAYEAYDKGRLPFRIDVKAFFKVKDAEEAAQRVESFSELKNQLKDILKGAVRTILASSDIETILSDRGTFGDKFTEEVSSQLISWGVTTVKNIEFMDIKDTEKSQVIANIMEKKKSEIEMESRKEVAKNQKEANIAEIEATKEAAIREQEADRDVGIQTAEKEKRIGIARELANQEIAEQTKITTEKQMAVKLTQEEKQANIEKTVAKIQAERDKEIKIIAAEALAKAAEEEKNQKRLDSEAKLIQKQNEAEGLIAEGDAKAAAVESMGIAQGNALKASEMAPIQAQIALAKEIGENAGYQEYLVKIEAIKAELSVGIEKAKALSGSDVKIIANTGDVQTGINSFLDLFSSKGGSQLGALLEGFKNTDIGKDIIDIFMPDEEQILDNEMD